MLKFIAGYIGGIVGAYQHAKEEAAKRAPIYTASFNGGENKYSDVITLEIHQGDPERLLIFKTEIFDHQLGRTRTFPVGNFNLRSVDLMINNLECRDDQVRPFMSFSDGEQYPLELGVTNDVYTARAQAALTGALRAVNLTVKRPADPSNTDPSGNGPTAGGPNPPGESKQAVVLQLVKPTT